MIIYFRDCLKTCLGALDRDAWLHAVIASYTALCIFLLVLAGRTDLAAHTNYVDQWTVLFLGIIPAAAIAYDIIYVFIRFDRGRLRLYRKVFSARRMGHLLAGMATMMLLMVFQGSFTSIKNLFPVFQNGFPYDRVHADIDVWLHFGYEPWELLKPFFSPPKIMWAIEVNYNVLWFFLCFGALFYVVSSPRAQAIRARYLTMFIGTWIICGNVLASMFLSAGPAFYGKVTGDEQRFATLDMLVNSNAGPSSAFAFQTYLWTLYEEGRAGFGSGISAFPSVHVALITMNALFAAERSRTLGIIAAIYTFLVILSSVFLGWHYAIDGYVSAIVVAAGHFALRALFQRQPQSASHAHVASPSRA